jgi:hypothetical protein
MSRRHSRAREGRGSRGGGGSAARTLLVVRGQASARASEREPLTGDGELGPPVPHLLEGRIELGEVLGVEHGILGVDDRAAVAVPRVVVAAVVHGHVHALLLGHDVPVVLVVQEVVVVVVEDGRVILVLPKLLHGLARDEVGAGEWVLDAPLQITHQLAREGLLRLPAGLDGLGSSRRVELKLVQLAVEDVEGLVQAGRDVPRAREGLRVELLDQRIPRRHGPRAVVRPLRHAILGRDRALGELVHRWAAEFVTARDLAVALVGTVVAGLDAD